MTDALILDAKLDLPAAAKLAADMKQRLGGDIVLDARDVTQIGALCLQVILAAGTAVRQSGHRIRIDNLTEKMSAQLGHMGITPDMITEGA